jgi:hypothetical protein
MGTNMKKLFIKQKKDYNLITTAWINNKESDNLQLLRNLVLQ